jgi:type 1 fimbria pilin
VGRSIVVLYLVLLSVLGAYADPQATIKFDGQISDQGNAVIPNAVVRVFTPDRLIETKSDPQGHFELSGLLPGTYPLEVFAPGFKPQIIDGVQLKDQQTETTIRLTLSVGEASPPCVPAWHSGIPIGDSVSYDSRSDDFNVIGTIYDNGAGRPLSNVAIYLSRSDQSPQLVSTSDEKGEFHIRRVEPGRYTLTVSREGYWIYPPKFPAWVTRQNVTKFLLLMEPPNICH